MLITSQREIGAFDAKNKFGTLLDWVEAGEEIIITRRGRAVARLISANPGHDKAQAQRAAVALLDATRGLRLNGLTVSELKAQGRR